MREYYFIEQILPVIVIGALYLLIISGLTVFLKRIGVSLKNAILFFCLIFGAVMGLLTVWLWPDDVSVIVNFPAAFLGDWIYQNSIQYLGDPSSPQAHYTIPWLLRVPQVYVMASILCWGTAGALAQLVYNIAIRRKNALNEQSPR